MAGCLRACPGCARHLRATERACPFCGQALHEGFGVCVPPPVPGRALSRAALVFASAAAMSACGKTGGRGSDGRAHPLQPMTAVPPYSPAAPDDIPERHPLPVDAGGGAASATAPTPEDPRGKGKGDPGF
jgi:hypothetical protein